MSPLHWFNVALATPTQMPIYYGVPSWNGRPERSLGGAAVLDKLYFEVSGTKGSKSKED
jgi:hypothetical protein